MNPATVQATFFPNVYSTTLLLIALALLAHQVFRRHETYSIPIHAVLLLVPPTFVALCDCVITTSISSPASPYTTSYYYGLYFGVLTFSVILYRLSPWHPLAQYPGPLLCRTTKLWNAFITVDGRQNRYYLALHERYGDIVRIGPNELTIRDPSLIGALMGSSGVGKGPNFVGAMLTETNVPMVGISDTEEHLRRRRAWNRGLGPSALKEFQHLIIKRARQLVDRLAEQNGVVDMGKWFNYFSYDFMCDMAFGGGSELLQEGDKNHVWRVIEEGVVPATFLSQVPWLGIYISHIPAAVKPLNEFILHGQGFAMQRLERGSTTRDLFHYLNNEDLPERQPPPMRQLIDDGILAIVAGADTVSSAMNSIVFCLLAYPDAYKRLQAEVDKFYPQGENVFDMKYHREMPYLQAVINEAVRLFPPVMTSSPRKVPHSSSGVQAGSIYLPAGTQFIVPPYSLHRDARNFTFPNTFWPERWLIASGQMSLSDAPLPSPASPSDPSPISGDAKALQLHHNEAAFMAFSHGPLNCVGKGLGMQEMRTVVCALLHRFEVRFRDGYDVGEYEKGYKDYFVATRPEVPVLLTTRA
ncbi:high nitrogen upregulated cytochrome P450 monooxygenase 2 [Fomes fomentarius]|nr:high nitrogen upregulated cytochrome P450 monooxygenase 2 [Fomes fomentarius]